MFEAGAANQDKEEEYSVCEGSEEAVYGGE